MAGSSLIDMEIDTSADSQLQFQEFPASNVPGPVAELDVRSSHTLTFNHSPDTPGSDTEGPESELLRDGPQKPSPSFWTFEFYQKLFDVDTQTVVDRILWSMIPRPGHSYLQHHIRPKPDLYGPFWICTTLIFAIAISGNLANYLQTAGKDFHWKYNFRVVTYAASAVYSYAWITPMVLWAYLRWCGGQEARLGFLEMMCVYGYSLSIYIPVSILWLIEVDWLQWLILGVGAALSGSVLLMTAWPAVQKTHRLPVLAAVLGLHLLLAAGFMLCFFHAPHTSLTTTTTPQPAAVVSVSVSSTSAAAQPQPQH
ncbi:hypothetical protein R5R35_007810 [Gryllus longicercus]|uniref:Protein YIPF n=1 Tax=Gryllus longicercus TaxID=2509291 RepID=A0AAN9WWA6_9ORTH